jgi:hypothetical protein
MATVPSFIGFSRNVTTKSTNCSSNGSTGKRPASDDFAQQRSAPCSDGGSSQGLLLGPVQVRACGKGGDKEKNNKVNRYMFHFDPPSSIPNVADGH